MWVIIIFFRYFKLQIKKYLMFQIFLLKMCKKNCRHPLVDINNINVPGQRICSHFLVQIPRADAEIVTNKLPLIFFFFY
jgi:hypothetical protein